ncbi:hypothetical protein BaRGS_00016676 [Batillaria attramentaria]|uniref:Uncharacterized protein n=1 Tax=Batillaria attramentaria TaxID=370345 RepID=A0ABD0KZ29_9CAEN
MQGHSEQTAEKKVPFCSQQMLLAICDCHKNSGTQGLHLLFETGESEEEHVTCVLQQRMAYEDLKRMLHEISVCTVSEF